MNATHNSMLRPSRGGIVNLNRMMAEPTTRIVSVCPSPQRAPMSSRVQHRALAADDGRHGHDVIGIGGVPHPEKKSQQHDGEQSGHSSSFSIELPPR